MNMIVQPSRFSAGGGGPITTSYTNPLGSGNRIGSLIVTSNTSFASSGISIMINGNISENLTFWNSGAALGRWFKGDFAVGKVIDEFKWHQSTAATHGVFQMQGSNDDVNWTNVGSTFTLGGAGVNTYAITPSSTFYRYWRIIGVSGTCSNGPFLREIQYKISV